MRMFTRRHSLRSAGSPISFRFLPVHKEHSESEVCFKHKADDGCEYDFHVLLLNCLFDRAKIQHAILVRKYTEAFNGVFIIG